MMVWFETILVALTALTGLVWLLDKLVLAKRRKVAGRTSNASLVNTSAAIQLELAFRLRWPWQTWLMGAKTGAKRGANADRLQAAQSDVPRRLAQLSGSSGDVRRRFDHALQAGGHWFETCCAHRFAEVSRLAFAASLTSMSQARRAWLLFVLVPVFDLHVRLASGGRRAVLPGVPGSAPAPTAPGCSSFGVDGAAGAGQVGAGRAQSRCQQVRNASFHGQSGLILRIRWRAWRTSLAGICQRR